MKYYSQEKLNHFLGIKGIETKTKAKTKKVIGSVELVYTSKKMIEELLENDSREES